MECEQAQKWMHAFIDEEINEQAFKKLNAHLDSCESCTIEFEELKYMVQLMGEIDLKELPLGYENELHDKLIVAAKEMASEKPIADRRPLFGNLIGRLSQFKMKRSYFAYAAIPAIMVITIFASKGFLGQQNADKAMSADSLMYGESTDGSMAGAFDQENVFTMEKSTAMAPQATNSPSDSTNDYREGRMIIQTASLRMDVEKYDDVMTELKAMISGAGGYIEDESSSYRYYNSDSDNLKYGYITIRMPSDAYNASLDQIKALGLVTLDSSNASDITKAYRDTASEIENLRVTEGRLREIMAQAVEIEDILSIENELTRVRGSISSYEKQIKDWESLVDMTTITVELNEVKNLKPKVEAIDESLFGKAKDGLINTINSIKHTFENFIIWLITSSPILVILALASYVISVIYKKIKRGGTKNEK